MVILSSDHLPLATHHCLCRQQFGLWFLAILVVLHIRDDAVVQSVEVMITHPLQARLPGYHPQPFVFHMDCLSQYFNPQVGTSHTPFAFRSQRNGGVAVAQSVHIPFLIVAPLGSTPVQQCVPRTFRATELIDGLLVHCKAVMPVGCRGQQVKLLEIKPDAYIIAVLGVEVNQFLMQLQTLAVVFPTFVARLGDDDVVGRRGHVEFLITLAILLDVLHGRPLQQVGMFQRLVILAQEGMAESLLQRFQRRQQLAVAGLGAVAHILLVRGRRHSHVVGRCQPIGADCALLVHPLGHLVGTLVRAVFHQLIELCPGRLCKQVHGD